MARIPRPLRATTIAVLLSVLGVGSALSAARPPCAPPAAPDPMPEGDDHDHANPAHHRLECGLESVAFRGLEGLVPEPTQFGEVDVAGGIAVMALAYPEAGFIVFDVSDPQNPRALARFRGPRCEEVVIDVDCGADVKLRPDGRTAFLAIQKPGVPEGEPPGTRILPETPGIMAVDLSDPRAPKLASLTPVPPKGSHMIGYHEIGGKGYVFAVRNGVGFQVFRVDGAGLATRLVSVAEVMTPSVHDVFLFADPTDARTYLYFSAGRAGALIIYDVTDPVRPRAVGEWKPVPERPNEKWYIHGAWTFRAEGRRFTLVGPELFSPDEWHGSVAGPVWLLDTTDHARPRLVGEWSNPGGHVAGELGFSPHQIAFFDGLTYLSHYHGGVWLLDWRRVLRREARRPEEIGYYVPHSSRRPFLRVHTRHRFLSAADIFSRPLIWDVVSDGTYAYVSDINGGLYVLARPVRGESEPRGPGLRIGAGAAALIALGFLVGALRRHRRRPAVEQDALP